MIALLSLLIAEACYNNCNRNGRCTKFQTCDCFSGYEGNDCSRRICPSGPAFADVPSAINTAHLDKVCSGNGVCDHNSGTCNCNSGFHGHNCGRTHCNNNCNGHGRCMNLKTAAEEYDGYHLNHSTTYSQWDAEIIYGCICDYGWNGADCSQRSCEYGIDPRLSELQKQSVTLVCNCESGDCHGKFKLQYFGSVLKTWLYPSSTVKDLIAAVMSAPGISKNTTVITYNTIQTANSSVANSDALCISGRKIKRTIKFQRNAGNLPPIAFYANLFTAGQVYFETEQTLQCNCMYHHCNGTFRVSFDGEMSSRINGFTNGTEVITALQDMYTVQSAGFTVTTDSYLTTGGLCRDGAISNFTIVFRGSSGNAPVIGLWNSVVRGANGDLQYYSTNNTEDVLRVITNDGRDEHVKLCNGIGKCNFATGICECPYGWGFDGDIGPCGKLIIPSSQWGGLARCPGVITANDLTSDAKIALDGTPNYLTRVYLSVNPTPQNNSELNNTYGTLANSAIYHYTWSPVTTRGARIDYSTETFFVNLTSNSSAGPLILDQAKDQIIFVDANPAQRFIGKATQFPGDANNYTIWLSMDYEIFGLTFDALYSTRRLFWSAPGLNGVADGEIYWAYLDDVLPTVSSFSAVLTTRAHVFNPYGLAWHYGKKRLYWVDRNVTARYFGSHSVLRSADYDGSLFEEQFIFQVVDNITIGLNLTDLVIDFANNDTALFLDSDPPYYPIVAVNLAEPSYFNNDTRFDDVVQLNINYYSPRVILDAQTLPMQEPRYLVADHKTEYLLFTDTQLDRIGYARYDFVAEDPFSSGTAFSGMNENQQRRYKAVGIMFDYGLGKVQNGLTLDCYGRGVCEGLENNYNCRCNDGFDGDCQAARCPLGKAWFQEPFIHDIAHDNFIECSNAGVCNRNSGQCACFTGFEGNACQRTTCENNGEEDSQCRGAGRCLSLRDIGEFHKDGNLDADPIVYGSKAGDPAAWDADIIYTCKADEYGFGSNAEYNISSAQDANMNSYDCPNGFNERLLTYFTTNVSIVGNYQRNYTNFREIQQIECNAYQGYFRLSFRGQVSRKIYANASQVEVKNILENVPTIGEVLVSTPGDDLCIASQRTFSNITFISQIGNVPLLQVYENNLGGRTGSITINRLQASSARDLQECSGHGACDLGSGLCKCWDGYGTSDGRGNVGTRGDCGRYLLD